MVSKFRHSVLLLFLFVDFVEGRFVFAGNFYSGMYMMLSFISRFLFSFPDGLLSVFVFAECPYSSLRFSFWYLQVLNLVDFSSGVVVRSFILFFGHLRSWFLFSFLVFLLYRYLYLVFPL